MELRPEYVKIERLREAISYDPLSGICVWKTRPLHHFKDAHYWKIWNVLYASKPIGYVMKVHGKSYLRATFDRKGFLLHRAIIAMTTGEWPLQTDHQDGNGLNNRLKNIISTDGFGNQQNRRRCEGRVLPTGIYPKRGKYAASISVGGKTISIGTFDDLPAATSARKEAERKYGFHPNHGMVRPL